MKTIEFTQSRTVEDAAGKVVSTFEEGKRYKLEDASADRWIRRGVAFDVKAKDELEEVGTGESAEKVKKGAK